MSQVPKPHSEFDLSREFDHLFLARDDGYYDKSRDHEENITAAFKSLQEQLERVTLACDEGWSKAGKLEEQLEATQQERSLAGTRIRELQEQLEAAQAEVKEWEFANPTANWKMRHDELKEQKEAQDVEIGRLRDALIDILTMSEGKGGQAKYGTVARGALYPASTPDARRSDTDA